eukprot:2039729-Rhodomonas_salina.1
MDCMTILSLITCWKRGDKQPRIEDKSHPDIISEAINALYARRSPTLIVWIRAHIGDAGNEQADAEARAGTLADNTEWEIETSPIALHSNLSNTFPLLHEAKWTSTVERHARRHVGACQAEYLSTNSDAKS